MLEGDDPGEGAFAPFFCPQPGAIRPVIWLHPEEFAQFFFKKKLANAWGEGLLKLTDAFIE